MAWEQKMWKMQCQVLWWEFEAWKIKELRLCYVNTIKSDWWIDTLRQWGQNVLCIYLTVLLLFKQPLSTDKICVRSRSNYFLEKTLIREELLGCLEHRPWPHRHVGTLTWILMWKKSVIEVHHCKSMASSLSAGQLDQFGGMDQGVEWLSRDRTVTGSIPESLSKKLNVSWVCVNVLQLA